MRRSDRTTSSANNTCCQQPFLSSVGVSGARELHTARLEGSLERLCPLYADEARLRIAGSTDGKPIAIAATGIAEIRPWLSILVKTFRLTQYTILSLTIDAPRAAAHWRVDSCPSSADRLQRDARNVARVMLE